MLSLGSSVLAALIGAAVIAWPMAVDARPPTAELDFLTEQMQRAHFNVLKFDLNTPVVKTAHGSLAPHFVDVDPVLATLPGEGVGQARVKLGACAILQPHSHPRGTELAYVTKGKLFFGVREEDGGRFLGSSVSEGQSFTFPQGLIHYNQNLGCEDAEFLASFPTRDPGTVTAASALVQLPLAAQRASLGVEDAEVKAIDKVILDSPNFSLDPVCARRCGLSG